MQVSRIHPIVGREGEKEWWGEDGKIQMTCTKINVQCSGCFTNAAKPLLSSHAIRTCVDSNGFDNERCIFFPVFSQIIESPHLRAYVLTLR